MVCNFFNDKLLLWMGDFWIDVEMKERGEKREEVPWITGRKSDGRFGRSCVLLMCCFSRDDNNGFIPTRYARGLVIVYLFFSGSWVFGLG
jgi:hypothetical protein